MFKYYRIVLISHASKVMLKILQNSPSHLQLPVMFKVDLQKLEESEIKLSISVESSKKQESSRKTSPSALVTMPKPLMCGS